MLILRRETVISRREIKNNLGLFKKCNWILVFLEVELRGFPYIGLTQIRK